MSVNLSGLQWKEKIRSPFWQKNVILNVILGFVIVMMSSYLVMLGVFIDKIFAEIAPSENPVVLFNGILFFYLLSDYLMRSMLQSLPVVSIKPLLTLNISKSKIVHFLLRKSLFHAMNILPWLVILPFYFKVVSYEYATPQAILWLVTVLLLVLGNNYMIAFVKRATNVKPIANLAFFVFIIGIIYLHRIELINFSEPFGNFMEWSAESTLGISVPLAYLVLSYFLAFKTLRKQTYMEVLDKSEKKEVAKAGGITALKKFGFIGQLMDLELKLIFRNKRPKQIFYLAIFMLAYGMFFYTQEIYMKSEFMMIFLGIFITGIFMIMYGQLLFSWESSYFDYILSNDISPKDMLEAKYYLFLATTTVAWIASLAYGYFDVKIMFFHTAMYLLNIGLNPFVLFWLTIYNKKRVDLGRGAMMNYQGVGATQFLLMIPIIFVPVALFYLTRIFASENLSLIILGVIGLTGVFLHKYILAALAKKLHARKYAMATGFRIK